MPAPTVVELTGVAGLLLVTICLGTVVHELTHAAALSVFGIPYTVVWLSDRSSGQFAAGVAGTWASVVPQTVQVDTSPWEVRLAAMAPVVLAVPFLTIPLGFVPESVVMGDVARLAVAIAWLGCALPSPQDFSLFWYAERALDLAS